MRIPSHVRWASEAGLAEIATAIAEEIGREVLGVTHRAAGV
jgi:hypothetical protein